MDGSAVFLIVLALVMIPIFLWAYDQDPAANPDLGDQRDHDREQPGFLFALVGGLGLIFVIFGLAGFW